MSRSKPTKKNIGQQVRIVCTDGSVETADADARNWLSASPPSTWAASGPGCPC